ncbi:Uncharacterised protein [Vibrio cholerae]|nr:Uncharacterised protein [Vibrio cholerae]CSI34201.1 Uncharacterised protein [Vibrio cholerae]
MQRPFGGWPSRPNDRSKWITHGLQQCEPPHE